MKKISLISVVAIFIAVAVVSCKDDPPPSTTPPDNPEPGVDTFVSKKIETATFLLEELTGVSCGYCPDGHKKADDLAAITFPGKFFVINVHAGSYANWPPPNDLRTDFGEALVSFSKTTGFPAGMINRRVFPAPYPQQVNAPAMSRGYWGTVCNSIASEVPYVNVAARTTINSADRTLECKVQVYYTDDATALINNINVAVLQNEIVARQDEYGDYYPERHTSDGKYRHMHVLRHLVTGQWGEAIDSEMKKGNLYEKTFTWTVPTDMKTLPMPLENLEVLVFITEMVNTPVIKVCKSTIEIK